VALHAFQEFLVDGVSGGVADDGGGFALGAFGGGLVLVAPLGDVFWREHGVAGEAAAGHAGHQGVLVVVRVLVGVDVGGIVLGVWHENLRKHGRWKA